MDIKIYEPFLQPATPLLYGSKVSTAQECLAKYFFRYHLHLDTKERPTYFAVGSWYHKMCELFLTPDEGEDAVNAYLLGLETEEKTKILLLTMFDAFKAKWLEEDRKVISLERTLMSAIPSVVSKHFTHWCTKADLEFEQDGKFWLGDHKTTSSYGPATAAYYHKSFQTKTYFTCSKMEQPELYGTKIFVTTKQKVRCEEETIVLHETDMRQAFTHMSEAAASLTIAEVTGDFWRSCTACINSYGHECPYLPICMAAKITPAYLEDVIPTWYTVSDPDEHLELTDEQRNSLPRRKLTDSMVSVSKADSLIIDPNKMYPSAKPRKDIS